MMAVNSSASLRAGLQVRPAVAADRQQIADLIYSEPHVHRHLDWRAPLDWLGYSPYWVLQEDEQIIATLACPPDPDSIAWIRLFVYAARLSASSAWSPLWKAARQELAGRGSVTVTAIAIQNWFDSILLGSGFKLLQHIVLLERGSEPSRSRIARVNATLRQMDIDDLPKVAEVDSAAFDPLWRNSLEALNEAFSQAIYASVAEDASGMIGYQISTGNPLGAHLARLAVRPEVQGRGIAKMLVNDLIMHVTQNESTSRITVNTQADNSSSLALYRKMGFRRTGEQYPVYTCQVE